MLLPALGGRLGHHLCYLTCCRLTLNYGHAKANLPRKREAGDHRGGAAAAVEGGGAVYCRSEFGGRPDTKD